MQTTIIGHSNPIAITFFFLFVAATDFYTLLGKRQTLTGMLLREL